MNAQVSRNKFLKPLIPIVLSFQIIGLSEPIGVEMEGELGQMFSFSDFQKRQLFEGPQNGSAGFKKLGSSFPLPAEHRGIVSRIDIGELSFLKDRKSTRLNSSHVK